MSNDNPDIQLVGFTLGDNLFAVDIMRIREIINPQKLTALPGASQILEGVINLRETVIPVMNMRKRFGMPDVVDSITGKILIVSLPCQALALMVDDVLDVITVPAREIKPPPDTADFIVIKHLLGICLSDDWVFMILDIDSLLDQSECRDAVIAQSEG
jgi:purine-binding chemotaxis protein CheW